MGQGQAGWRHPGAVIPRARLGFPALDCQESFFNPALTEAGVYRAQLKVTFTPFCNCLCSPCSSLC